MRTLQGIVLGLGLHTFPILLASVNAASLTPISQTRSITVELRGLAEWKGASANDYARFENELALSETDQFGTFHFANACQVSEIGEDWIRANGATRSVNRGRAQSLMRVDFRVDVGQPYLIRGEIGGLRSIGPGSATALLELVRLPDVSIARIALAVERDVVSRRTMFDSGHLGLGEYRLEMNLVSVGSQLLARAEADLLFTLGRLVSVEPSTWSAIKSLYR